MATGFAHLVTGPRQLARQEAQLTSWISERIEHAAVIALARDDGFYLTGTARL